MTNALNPTYKNHSAGAPSSSTPSTRTNRRLIALTGFMGCGKSTVARLLARQIGWFHADLDKRIAEQASMAISAIFAQLGEPAFRKIEHEALKRILGESIEPSRPTIISLGGGTMVQAQNLDALRQANCPTVWLDCQIDELIRRCSHITDRPLFRDEASFRQLYAQRLPFYELAEHRVESAVEPLRVVQNIIALGILEGVPT
ncbi:MAG TPA: shikimate kinase [Candidatus Acidoferrales bacterium]|nr:shikimate kinase [Candidatus Acidoferrales bacterium]